MRHNRLVLIGSWLLLLSLTPQALALNVVTSIRPIHSLVAAVMAGGARPYLIIRSGASPHDYSLRPSDAGALETAQLIFWVGAALENFLSGPLRALAPQARSVELLESPGVRQLQSRDLLHQGKHASPPQPPDGHGPADLDPHVWLNPDNAQAMVIAIRQALTKADPGNSARYRRNARQMDLRLTRLANRIDTLLAPVRDQPYVVYHDAYQYFDQRFGLKPAAAVTLHPELPAGVGRIRRIQELIRGRQIHCVFSEPQFQPRALRILLQIPGVHSAVLDPLGADLAPGPDLYAQLLLADARAIKTCLSK